MTYQHVQLLRVYAWDTYVGAIVPTARGTAFEYDPAWARRKIELAPLLTPTTSRRRVFTYTGVDDNTFHGLPPMLADAAPDRFGNALINAVLAREGVGSSDITALDRLAYVGARAMGALTFRPDSSATIAATAIEMSELVTAARAALHGDLSAETLRTHAMKDLIAVGTSAGGARAKAVLAWNRGTGQLRAGNVPVPPGFEQWLLKFDGLGLDDQLGAGQEYGRTEYAYFLMARDAGLDMADSELLEEGGRAHFITRRFDRPGTDGDRLHMQSLCAVAGLDYNLIGTHDYASYFTTAQALGVGATNQSFRRMVFNVLASNNDDHTKNLAFLMAPDGTWELAPAYDVTYAYNPVGRWTRQHLMSVNGRFDNITTSDLLTVADRFEVPAARETIGEVGDAIARWPTFAGEAGLGETRTREVAGRLAAVRHALVA